MIMLDRLALRRDVSFHLEALETRALLAADLVGDFNGDLTVNAADYSVWRDSLGQMVEAGTGADASGDGEINQADYQLWRDNFGAIGASAASSGRGR